MPPLESRRQLRLNVEAPMGLLWYRKHIEPSLKAGSRLFPSFRWGPVFLFTSRAEMETPYSTSYHPAENTCELTGAFVFGFRPSEEVGNFLLAAPATGSLIWAAGTFRSFVPDWDWLLKPSKFVNLSVEFTS